MKKEESEGQRRLCELSEMSWEKLQEVTELDLSFKEIGDNFPIELGKLIQLTGLNLQYNHLVEIPKEIGKLTKLESLNLYGNKLSELPKEIASLPHLNWLNFNENPIRELPEEFDQMK